MTNADKIAAALDEAARTGKQVTVTSEDASVTLSVPGAGWIACRNCGAILESEAGNADCPTPSPGKPYVDCGRGGHWFDVPVPTPPRLKPDRSNADECWAAARRDVFATGRGEVRREDGTLVCAMSIPQTALECDFEGCVELRAEVTRLRIDRDSYANSQFERQIDELHVALGKAKRERDELRAAKDGAYNERDRCVAALAWCSYKLGWRVGVGQHDPNDANWDTDWRTIVFIDFPTGQASWHIHDSEVPLVAGLPAYEGTWDGHSTPEKYARLERLAATKGDGK